MHDAQNRELKIGDVVLIPATITQVSENPDFCNVSVQTFFGRRPDGKTENISAINTGVLLRANADDENDLSVLHPPVNPAPVSEPAGESEEDKTAE